VGATSGLWTVMEKQFCTVDLPFWPFLPLWPFLESTTCVFSTSCTGSTPAASTIPSLYEVASASPSVLCLRCWRCKYDLVPHLCRAQSIRLGVPIRFKGCPHVRSTISHIVPQAKSLTRPPSRWGGETCERMYRIARLKRAKGSLYPVTGFLSAFYGIRGGSEPGMTGHWPGALHE
jgi:hypothetical protein